MEFNIWSTKWAFDMKAIIEWAKNLWLNLSGKKKWKNWEILAFWVKKESYLIMLGIFAILLLTTLIFIGLAFYRNHSLNQRLTQLEQLKNYQLNTFKNDELWLILKTNFQPTSMRCWSGTLLQKLQKRELKQSSTSKKVYIQIFWEIFSFHHSIFGKIHILNKLTSVFLVKNISKKIHTKTSLSFLSGVASSEKVVKISEPMKS